jgi:integrase/recombinase XerC
MNEREWLKRYFAFLDVERGYGVNTLTTYGRILTDFVEFLNSRRTTVRRLHRNDLGSYVQMLRAARGNSARSIRLKLQAIRSFLGYLSEHGARPRDTSLGKNDFRYKVEQRQAESLSQSQLAALLDTVQRQVKHAREAMTRASKSARREAKQLFAAGRDLCLLTLLASTGLRISEALGITFADIDPVDKSILILGKGKKYRKVFFDLPALQPVLQSYLEARQALSVDHDVLFVSTKAYRPLQPRGVQKALKGYLRKAGLTSIASPHSLRHSFATLAIERGANIKAVSQILGHANCSITINLYTHLSNEHLREVMQLCSPLSKVEIPLEERIRMRKQHLAYIEKSG